jgi:phosphate transport system permease protein
MKVSGLLLERLSPQEQRRLRTDRLMGLFLRICAGIAVLPVVALTVYVALRGIPALSPTFFLNNPADTEPGILNAILGSLQLTAVAILFTGPIGIAAGVYLSEYASQRVSSAGTMMIDVLLGTPSIIAGLVVFLVAVPFLGFSAWAGVLALSVLMLPVVMRTTQEVIRLVPIGVREASLALGVPVWKTTLYITCRTALSGLLTGLVLAISRGLGETAPLLLTARGTSAMNLFDFGTTINAMPMAVYEYSNTSSTLLKEQAWGTALVLLAIALTLNVLVRSRTINSRVA